MWQTGFQVFDFVYCVGFLYGDNSLSQDNFSWFCFSFVPYLLTEKHSKYNQKQDVTQSKTKKNCINILYPTGLDLT